jgi:hypothetical protein
MLAFLPRILILFGPPPFTVVFSILLYVPYLHNSKSVIDAGYDVPALSQNLDAIHLMSYDLHGSWESTVNHHAPLYSSTAGDQLTVDFA